MSFRPVIRPVARAVARAVNSKTGFSPLELFAQGEQGVWYDPSDLSTLYQDAAGTIPVTADGDPVGLMLDKSQGLELGPELVTNGTFDTDTDWTNPGTWDLTNGRAEQVVGTNGELTQINVFPAGGTYRVSWEQSTAGRFFLRGPGFTQIGVRGSGSKSYVVTTTTSGAIGFEQAATSAGDWIDNISVRELKGNHATQTVAASRPVYQRGDSRGVVNLLLSTETLNTQSRTVTAVAHTLSFTGTGSVTLSGASTAGPLVGTGVNDRVSLTFTPTEGSLTLTVSGSVTKAQLEKGSTPTAYQRNDSHLGGVATGSEDDLHWLADDKVDDVMTATLPAMPTATVATATDDGVVINYPVNIPAGAYSVDTTSTQGFDYGRVIVDRQLTAPEQTTLTTYLEDKS